jgi:hypothetical protein
VQRVRTSCSAACRWRGVAKPRAGACVLIQSAAESDTVLRTARAGLDGLGVCSRLRGPASAFTFALLAAYGGWSGSDFGIGGTPDHTYQLSRETQGHPRFVLAAYLVRVYVTA